MKSCSLHRLTAVLCTVCLSQLAVIEPSLAEPDSSAKPAASQPVEATPAPGTVNQGATGATASTTISATTAGAQPKGKGWLGLDWTATRRILERFAPYLGLYYARSVAQYESSDFSHSLGFFTGVDFTAMPSLILSTDVALYRQLGEEYDRFVLSNWSFAATRTVKLPHAGVLHPRFFVNLPTNPDDREFLTYRGTIGADVELRKYNFYKFHKDHAFGGSIGFGTARNMYAETANEAGYPNRTWQVSGFASLNYKFRRSLMLIVKFRNNWYWYPEGNRANDAFRLSAAINYSPIQQLWLALSAVSVDRTFLYDQTSLNLALYSAESTSVIFSMTYLPKLSKTHELAR